MGAAALLLSACGDADRTDPLGADAGVEDPDAQEETTDPSNATDPADADADDGEPLQVGVLMPLTGPLAVLGEEAIAGWQLYWETHGTSVAGREISWVTADTQGDPSAARNEAQQLVERQNVDLVWGPLSGAEGGPVAGYLSEHDVPHLFAFAYSRGWLDQRPPNLATQNFAFVQHGLVLGEWAAGNGYERVLTVCSDYLTGWETCGGFASTFSDHGGVIVEQLWPALQTPDWSPIMAQIDAAQPDAVFLTAPGAAGIAFFEAYQSFGLQDIPLLSTQTTIEASTIRAMGERADGITSTAFYAESLDTPAATEFRDAWVEAHGTLPGGPAVSGWVGAQLLSAALEELGGSFGSATELRDAIQGLSLETAFGDLSFDDRGNAVLNVYIREARATAPDGGMWNEVVETWEALPPTYPYDLDAFQEQEDFTASYQGIDWPTDCSAYADGADCPLG